MKLINGLAVYESGNSSHQPVIFIHGFPFDHQMWKNQVEFLKNDYYCITYDLRGLGQSHVGDGQYTIEGYADDLFNLMGELKLENPVVCGLSMGGYIALRAIEKDEKQFGGMILIDTKSAADNDEGRLKRAAGIKKINSEGSEKFIEEFVPGCFGDIALKEMPEVYDKVLKRSLRSNPVGLKGCLLAMAGRTDTTPYLENITIPSLIICGSIDKLVPPPVMREMSDRIKASEFAAVPRAGHLSPLENPEFINDMLAGFLRRRII